LWSSTAALAEDLLREPDAADQGDGQQAEGDRDHAKQQRLHGQDRRQAAEAAGHRALVQLAFGKAHEDGVQRRQGEQAVGQHRRQEMDHEAETAGMADDAQLREDGRRRRTGCGQRQDHRLQAVHARAKALQPVDQYRQPEHERQRVAERETHAAASEDTLVQAEALDQQRDDDRRPFPRLHRQRHQRALLLAPARVPEVEPEGRVEQ
jgi:hypothetical protein